MDYTGTFEIIAGNNAAFVIPDEFVAQLDSGGRPKVTVAVNGSNFRTSIARMGGRYLLGINKARREEAGLTAGETYTLQIEPDREERTVELPADLATALGGDKAALGRWEALSFTAKREIAEPIEAAKKPETRERRVAKAVEALRS
ncbi:YdeI/OmpD-associated family protein [Microlunatus endophyticus]|nr:YdeI/OmpD-associated family protein [Microlunatus endophyticus]